MKIDTKYLDYAKSGLFMALGSVVDDDGNKIKIEIEDELLTGAARAALDYMANKLFGCDITLKKDEA